MKVFFDQRNGDSDFHQFVSTENFSGISILIVRIRIQSAEMKSAVGAERIMEFLHDIDKTVRITYHRPHQMIVIRGRMTIKYTLDQCTADLLVVTNLIQISFSSLEEHRVRSSSYPSVNRLAVRYLVSRDVKRPV